MDRSNVVAVVINAAKVSREELISIAPEFIPGFTPANSKPHATMLPLFFSAAKARSVEDTPTTLEFAAVTLVGAVPP
jgi:hypothetical protein